MKSESKATIDLNELTKEWSSNDDLPFIDAAIRTEIGRMASLGIKPTLIPRESGKESLKAIDFYVNSSAENHLEEAFPEADAGKSETDPLLLKVVLVCGPSHAGKSIYIAENLYREARDVIDLYQFQEFDSYPKTMNQRLATRLSYVFLEETAAATIQNSLFMEAGMRDFYAQQERDITDREPELVVIEGTYVKARRRADLIQDVKSIIGDRDDCSFECICILDDRGDKWMRGAFEIPTVKEGFDKVTVIEEYTASEPLEELQEIVDRQKARDRIKENGYFTSEA